MNENLPSSNIFNRWKVVAYIFFGLFLLFAIGSVMLVLNNQKLNQKNRELELKIDQNEQFQTALQLEVEHNRESLKMLRFPQNDLRKLYVKSSDKMLFLLWNRNTQSGILWSNDEFEQPKGTVFQLWIESQGAYHSVSLFYKDELEAISSPFTISKTNFDSVILTLEKLGGSSTPTLKNLVASTKKLS
ncbi:MAG TPA: anti-sigma factor [Fluviicola sp.]|nr:anti-sigma factor [Fluviicola sp.]